MQLKIKYLISFTLILMVGIFFYFPAQKIDLNIFHGDDRGLYHALNNLNGISDYLKFIFYSENYKFRPIANIYYILNYILFRDNFLYYIFSNILMLSVLIIFIIFIFDKELNYKILSTLFGIAILTSTFSLYMAWNITGSFETLACILFCILILINKSSSKNIFFYSLAISLLVIFTSERFLPAVLVCNLLMLKSKRCKFQSVILITLIYALSRYSLSIPLLVGTQVDNIQNSFQISRFILFYVQSILEIYGFSIGPRYLSGFEIPYWITLENIYNDGRLFKSIIFITVCLIFNIIIIKTLILSSIRNDYSHYIMIGLAFVAAASVTFRLEMRWLLPAFICYIISLHHLRVFASNRFVSIKVEIILILFLIHNFLYAKYYRSSVYFASEMHDRSIFKLIFGQ